MAIVTTVNLSGPVFDGTAEAIAARAVVAVRHRLADEGMKLAEGMFAASIRENRGVFMSQFTTTDSSRVYEWVSSWTKDGQPRSRTYTMPVDVPVNTTVVTNRLATYGPWLEGTGSRNETTRFKGYHGMRKAAQALNAMAVPIAETELGPYVAEMNG